LDHIIPDTMLEDERFLYVEMLKLLVNGNFVFN
jgi:hypothetical protein